MTRLLIASDAWRPQVNGVVRTYENVVGLLPEFGWTADVLSPNEFKTLPMPTYPEIQLALCTPAQIARRIEAVAPDFIHIATEGPIGLMVRRYCRKVGCSFTTSYHTKFPEYLAARVPFRRSWSYALMRGFHNAGAGVMVATPSLAAELSDKGFRRILPWTRGVDIDLYRPRPDRLFGEDGPIFLFVGRVAVEKNIEAFLKLDLPGRKVVVGGGPQLELLSARYPDVLFAGPKFGEDLARCYASADVFVFPSLTDTFGVVLLEAMASGVPVAAFPVTGPKDVVADGRSGVLSDDLGAAALQALKLDRSACRDYALSFSWTNCVQLFVDNITSANKAAALAAE